MKLVLAGLLASTAVAYDTSIKECWDVRLRDESYFCYGAVGWPLSKNVYYVQYERDLCKLPIAAHVFSRSITVRSAERKVGGTEVP